MSKRALKKYLSELDKEALETQLMELYERFSAVREYYNFAFNPKEDKLVQEAKAKIFNEYFPVKRKRPKARRSVAQKYIKRFLTLGVHAPLVADIMLYNLEVAQTFSEHRNVPYAFYKSMYNSYAEAVPYIALHGMLPEFKDRILGIYQRVSEASWPNEDDFSRVLDALE
ncbi:DUF6155 family protein [Flavobacteriaceae bacterium F89]|uniref:DUF6155 family protein n=1 Tax=Cerina litoralis TaxID=2874477 RepID=A0AAE3JSS3_9FLAO|nr:DUF6155 family protein [Cerina litoralis]MCG2460817.1 DUF6155 family protein [Cerina litoralis]